MTEVIEMLGFNRYDIEYIYRILAIACLVCIAKNILVLLTGEGVGQYCKKIRKEVVGLICILIFMFSIRNIGVSMIWIIFPIICLIVNVMVIYSRSVSTEISGE